MSHSPDPADTPSGQPVLAELVGDLVKQADGTWLLDGGDLGCARLLVLLRNAIVRLPADSIVHLRTTDPVAPIDLPAWCRMTGHRYLGPIPGSASGAATRYGVKAAAWPTPTHPDSPWRPA